MNMNMKVFFVIIGLSVLVSAGLIFTFKEFEKQYKVKIEFCDGRPPVTTMVMSIEEPSRHSIRNYKRGVPEYEDYLNVCDVKVVN